MNTLTDASDATTLRIAAHILHVRAKKHTFMLRVIIRVLQRTADRVDEGMAPIQ